MREILLQAITVLRGMWQWRWIGLLVACIVGAVAGGVVLRLPDEYEASARVWVDTDSVLRPLMSGLAVQPNVEQQVGILSRTLISRPNMEKLSRMADLDHTVKTKEERESLTDQLMKKVRIASTGRDNLYYLSYRHSDRDTTRRVVQALASIFVESSLGDKRKDTDVAKQFIDEQIRIYEGKLTEAETRLKEFKLRNLNSAVAEGRDSFTRISELNAALNQARLELREAENSRDALKRQVSGEEPIFLGAASSVPPTPETLASANIRTPEIDSRIDGMKKNLDQLLQRFTDQHPDVLGAQRVIKELEDQRAREIATRRAALAAMVASMPAGSPARSVSNNPVYQQLKVTLAESEANVASLQARVAEYERRYAQARGAMQIVPEIEAQLTQLNRDYEINKRNYEALVARREAAAISGQMDAAAAVADFRLIDPPRVSPQPVAPNRPVLLGLALLGAVAAGLAITFVASQLRPPFFDAQTLREVIALPVLGTVSLLAAESARRAERLRVAGFVACSIAFFTIYGAGILIVALTAARSA